MAERVILRIENLEGVQEGDKVIVGLEQALSTDSEPETFWSRIKGGDGYWPFWFGGFVTLLEKEREGKRVIEERSYGFNVKGTLIPEVNVNVYESGIPRFDYYSDFLQKFSPPIETNDVMCPERSEGPRRSRGSMTKN